MAQAAPWMGSDASANYNEYNDAPLLSESLDAPLLIVPDESLDRTVVVEDPNAAEQFKQSRLQTISSIVNTMMGTTIVALPFGLAESGIGTGLAIIALVGAVSCFTVLVVVESGPGSKDFAACVKLFLGHRMQMAAWAMSVAIIVGAAIVYHILMQETLFALVNTLMSACGVTGAPAGTGWTQWAAALVPWFLFPISNMQDLSMLIKFNSVGFLFLSYVIIFVISHGLHAMVVGGPMEAVTTLSTSDSPYSDSGILRIVVGGTANFASLGGMMMLSFFIHNCIQPIIRNADPKTRRADITIAYVIAGLLYACVGVLGYIGFVDAHTQQDCMAPSPALGASNGSVDSIGSDGGGAVTVGRVLGGIVSGVTARVSSLVLGSQPTAAPAVALVPPPDQSPCTLQSNFLAMFGTDLQTGSDIYAFTARCALLLQLFTVFPILLLIVRSQVWSLVLKHTQWPGFTRVAGLNFALMAVTFTFAALDLQISEVLRFVGAVGGFVIVFAVPAGIHYVSRHRQIRAEAESDKSRLTGDGEEHGYSINDPLSATAILSGPSGADGANFGSLFPPWKDGGRLTGGDAVDALVVVVGLFFLILQFAPNV